MGAARALSDCSLRSRGLHFGAAAFLSRSQMRTCLLLRSSRPAARDSHRAVFDCSLRSLRCSLGCRRLRRICRNGQALFRDLLLQIGGANIENPRSSSSLAEEWTHAGRAISDARSCVLELLQADRAQRVVSESGSAG
jgi:hypothetical protein